MTNQIQKAFQDIDLNIEKFLNENKAILEASKIIPFHDSFPLSQNGICAMIAPMGSGKTFQYLRMIAQSEVVFDHPIFETVAICSTSNKLDKTVRSLQGIIKKTTLRHINDSDLLGWINKYIRRVIKYDSINDFYLNKKINEEFERLMQKHVRSNKAKREQLLKYTANKLAQYNWKHIPHRGLLVLDDFASHPLLKSKDTDMSRLLKKLRHPLLNVIICVQTTKSISKDIKRSCSDFILFPGIGQEDFYDLVTESKLGTLGTKQDLWNQYIKVTDPHATIAYHIPARKIIISQK